MNFYFSWAVFINLFKELNSDFNFLFHWCPLHLSFLHLSVDCKFPLKYCFTLILHVMFAFSLSVTNTSWLRVWYLLWHVSYLDVCWLPSKQMEISSFSFLYWLLPSFHLVRKHTLLFQFLLFVETCFVSSILSVEVRVHVPMEHVCFCRMGM